MTLTTPKFTVENIDPDLLGEGLGDAFQRFLGELFKVERFKTRGRDGGIDLSETVGPDRVIYEAKSSEDASFKKAESAWKEVLGHLAKNLSTPDGPPKGNAQYRPWYRKAPTIRTYKFCVNAECNQDNPDTLRDIIKDDLDNLIASHKHLNHLKGIEVEVWHWGLLEQQLRQYPDLLYRWFPATRPRTLAPLDWAPHKRKKSLRSYLNPEELSYYALEEHMKTHPAPISVLSEEALLDRLSPEGSSGILAIGSGGFGKTRLIYELGLRAKERGWVVRKVASTGFEEKDLEHLLAQTPSETPVLLVVDYLEALPNFNRLEEMVHDSKHGLYYVANCRQSFYSSLSLFTDPDVIDLNGKPASEEQAWRDNYRKSSIHHILRDKGVPNFQVCAEECGQIPVLAVFFVYLHETGRDDDLRQILSELKQRGHFGNWLRRRMEASFRKGGNAIGDELPLLMAQFPMSNDVADRLSATFRRLFDILANDGWIEEVQLQDGLSSQWMMGHDILADGVLLDHLITSPRTATMFVADLFRTAREINTQHSAIVALARLSGDEALSHVSLPQAFSAAVKDAPEAWKPFRGQLFLVPLFTAEGKLALLRNHGDFWSGAEGNEAFQIGLAFAARFVIGRHGTDMEPDEALLLLWLERARVEIRSRNDVLTAGLKLFPVQFKPAALNSIKTHPQAFQTHFLLVAWLEAGLPASDVRGFVEMWLEFFPAKSNLTFVIRAWLNATQDGALVEASIREWLAVKSNRLSPEAQFVYTAWLKATQDGALVEASIREWLAVESNRLSPKAEFVYTAWLNATQDRALVEASIREWLAVKSNSISPEAGFVYAAWLGATQDGALVEASIREWLAVESNRLSPEAQFVYTAWLNATQDGALVEASIREWLAVRSNSISPEALFVYKPWLDATQDGALVEASIREWLAVKSNRLSPEAQFVYTAWLKATQDGALVEASIREWLAVKSNRLSPTAQYIYTSWLNVTQDRALVEAPVQEWLAVEGNCQLREADFLYRAWLEAEGSLHVVLLGLRGWLHHHRDEYDSVYVTKVLAGQRELPAQVVEDILHWCEKFCEDEDAPWRLSQLRNHTRRPELATAIVRTAGAVFNAQMNSANSLTMGGNANLNMIMQNLLTLAQSVDAVREDVDYLFIKWLRYLDKVPRIRSAPPPFQKYGLILIYRMKDLISLGQLDVVKDYNAIAKILCMVETWDREVKKELEGCLTDLARSHPAPGLWDIVTTN